MQKKELAKTFTLIGIQDIYGLLSPILSNFTFRDYKLRPRPWMWNVTWCLVDCRQGSFTSFKVKGCVHQAFFQSLWLLKLRWKRWQEIDECRKKSCHAYFYFLLRLKNVEIKVWPWCCLLFFHWKKLVLTGNCDVRNATDKDHDLETLAH